MQSYSFTIAVRIWHPNIDPAVISGNLKMKPEYAATAGTQRQTLQGRKLSGTYAESYWCSDPFEYGEYRSADNSGEDILADIIDVLMPSKAFLLLLREQGARIHLHISSFSGRNYGLEFSPEFLSCCAELGISIVHDVYPYAQNW